MKSPSLLLFGAALVFASPAGLLGAGTLTPAAQTVPAAQPARNARVDTAQPTYPAPAQHVRRYGGGGGDLSGDTLFVLFLGAIVIAGAWAGRCGTTSE